MFTYITENSANHNAQAARVTRERDATAPQTAAAAAAAFND